MKLLRQIFLVVFLVANGLATISCDPEEHKIPVALPDTEDGDNKEDDNTEDGDNQGNEGDVEQGDRKSVV